LRFRNIWLEIFERGVLETWLKLAGVGIWERGKRPGKKVFPLKGKGFFGLDKGFPE